MATKTADNYQKVLPGRNGFLFLHNDTNKVIDQIEGRTPLSADEIQDWDTELARRNAHARRHSYKYKFVLLPNKHVVYREELPESVHVGGDRAALQLARAFPDKISYPLDFLREHRSLLVYHQTDTHWNELGIALYMNKIASGIGSRALDFEVVRARWPGDLGQKCEPPIPGETRCIKTTAPEPRCVFSNKVPYNGLFMHYEYDDPALPVGIVFCDSFFVVYRHILARYFHRLYIFNGQVFDEGIIERVRPDVVLNESVERFVRAPVRRKFSALVEEKFFTPWRPGFEELKTLPLDVEKISGVDYALLRDYRDEMNAASDDRDFQKRRYEFLARRAPQHLKMPAERPFCGSWWTNSGPNEFTGWAWMFSAPALTVAGFAVHLYGLMDNTAFLLEVYTPTATDDILLPDFASFSRLYSRTYAREDLFIYDNKQEAFFPTPGIEVNPGQIYAVKISGNGFLGIGRSAPDLEVWEACSRGFFQLKADKWQPVGGNMSTAWRVIAKSAGCTGDSA